MLVAVIVILAGVVVVASGRGGEMAPEYPDYPPIDLGPVSAADVALLRPPSAAWGYNMRVTDEALKTIARAVTERDIKISALQQEVSDLREELAHDWTRQSGAPGRRWEPRERPRKRRGRERDPAQPSRYAPWTKRTRPRAPNGPAPRGLNLSRPSPRPPGPRAAGPQAAGPGRPGPRPPGRGRAPGRRARAGRAPGRRTRADRAPAGRLGSSPSRTGAPSGALRQRVLRRGALRRGALLRRARSRGRTVPGLGRAQWPGQLGRASPDARLGRGTPAGEGQPPPGTTSGPPAPGRAQRESAR